MRPSTIRGLLYAALALMILLHNDLWFYDDGSLVLGLPVGLAYHIGYCVASSLLMLLFVKLAWPPALDAQDDDEGPGR